MAATFDRLDDKLIDFIKRQKMFFVATAPLSAEGSVNLSPKGYDSFLIIDPLTVAYLDLGGSGIETMAHLRENGRITLMFCAFEGAARILRLYGRGETISFGEPAFAKWFGRFKGFSRARAVVIVRLTRIADSCGWSIPFYEFKSERDQLKRWVDTAEDGAWEEKRYASNALSIDGLPGLVRPEA